MRVRSTQLLRGKPRGAAERCTVASLECEAVQVDGHVDIEHSHVSTQFEAAILQPIAEAPEDHIKVRTLFNRFSPWLTDIWHEWVRIWGRVSQGEVSWCMVSAWCTWVQYSPFTGLDR